MAMTSQASHHGGCHASGGWVGRDWAGWVGRASWYCLSAGVVQRGRSDVHGSAEAPRVMGVEQVREPGHAPLQVGPHRHRVGGGQGAAVGMRQQAGLQRGRTGSGWQVLLMLARAADCARV
jgi:hypothetical protein